MKICPFSVLRMVKQLNSYCTVAFLRQLFMAIYILCAAAFGSHEQLRDSYRRAAEQLQNTATHFKGLHSVSAARCNLTLAAKRLPRRYKSAANPLFSHFAALLRRCTALLVSYGKDFFFTSCGSLIPFTRANAHWVIHGFNQHLNLHFRVNSLFHHLCSQCYAAQHLNGPLLSLRRDSPPKIVPDFLSPTSQLSQQSNGRSNPEVVGSIPTEIKKVFSLPRVVP